MPMGKPEKLRGVKSRRSSGFVGRIPRRRIPSRPRRDLPIPPTAPVEIRLANDLLLGGNKSVYWAHPIFLLGTAFYSC